MNSFSTLEAVLKKHFHKPDIQVVRIAAGALKAHYLNLGDPVWLHLVAPPSSGKTSTGISAMLDLPQVVPISEITDKTLLSGFHGHTETGILEKCGQTTEQSGTYTTRGDLILIAKDFSTILTLRRETRHAIFSQLREVYDGQFRRSFGTGLTKEWIGRATVLAAVTPEIDRHWAVGNALGQRFLMVRSKRTTMDAGERAIDQQGNEVLIAQEMRTEVQNIFGASSNSVPFLDACARLRITCLAELVSIARTPVARDGRSRQIEHVLEPESNTRLSKEFAALARGIAALNQTNAVTPSDIQDCARVALDTIPPVRAAIIRALVSGIAPRTLAVPRSVRDRAIEDLEELGVLEKNGNPTLTILFADLLNKAGPL